jgi:hypothetical protein
MPDNNKDIKPYKAKDLEDYAYRQQMYSDSLDLYNNYVESLATLTQALGEPKVSLPDVPLTSEEKKKLQEEQKKLYDTPGYVEQTRKDLGLYPGQNALILDQPRLARAEGGKRGLPGTVKNFGEIERSGNTFTSIPDNRMIPDYVYPLHPLIEATGTYGWEGDQHISKDSNIKYDPYTITANTKVNPLTGKEFTTYDVINPGLVVLPGYTKPVQPVLPPPPPPAMGKYDPRMSNPGTMELVLGQGFKKTFDDPIHLGQGVMQQTVGNWGYPRLPYDTPQTQIPLAPLQDSEMKVSLSALGVPSKESKIYLTDAGKRGDVINYATINEPGKAPRGITKKEYDEITALWSLSGDETAQAFKYGGNLNRYGNGTPLQYSWGLGETAPITPYANNPWGDTPEESLLKAAEDRARREELYKQIEPSHYGDIGNYWRYFFGGERDSLMDPRSEEAFKQYLSINDSPSYLYPSAYTPSVSADSNMAYQALDPTFEQSILDYYYANPMDVGENRQVSELWDYPGNEIPNPWSALGNFTIGMGEDEQGKYLSYYDRYDLPESIQDRLMGSPYEIYNRVRLNTPKPRKGVRENPDGSESTHLMMREYIPGQGWVAFPSLFQNEDGTWEDLSQEDWRKAYAKALSTGEVYNFGDNTRAAIEFADEGNWKKENSKLQLGTVK